MTKFLTIFFFCFSVVMMFCASPRQKRHKHVWLYVLILSLVAAFRPETMHDYENYHDFFVYQSSERMEVGFTYYVEFFKSIISSPIFLFWIVAILSIGLKISAINALSPFFWGSMLVFVSRFFVLHDMIQIRAAVASGLILWSTKYLYNRDIKRFAVIVVLATLFHTSALAIIPFWFLNPKHINTKLYLLLIPLAYILALGGVTFGRFVELIPIDRVQQGWRMYELAMEHDVFTTMNIFNIPLLFRIAVCVLLLCNIHTISQYWSMSVIWMKIYVVSIIIMPLLSDVPIMAFRLSELLQIVEIVLIPSLVIVPCKHFKGKLVVMVFALCCFGMDVFFSKLLG